MLIVSRGRSVINVKAFLIFLICNILFAAKYPELRICGFDRLIRISSIFLNHISQKMVTIESYKSVTVK